MIFADPYTLATSNRTRVVAETRLALAVTRPKAFCSVVVNTAQLGCPSRRPGPVVGLSVVGAVVAA